MRQRDFALLWRGETVSQVGGQISLFALPSIAILILHASPAQIGALQCMEFAIPAALAIVVGVFVDRVKRKPLLVAANLVRAFAVCGLAVAFVTHHLTLADFFLSGACIAIANVVFDTAYVAFVPALMGRERFGSANARLAMTASAAEAVGSSTSGAIVSYMGAPAALALNAITYAWSTVNLLRLRCSEPPPRPRRNSSNRFARFAREFREGIALVVRSAPLRAIATTSATAYFGGSMVMAVLALYAYRTLHVSPLLFGAIMGFGNIGLFGGMVARPIARRIGPRATLAIASALSGLAKLLFLIAPAPLAALVAGRLIVSFTGPIFNIVDHEIRAQCTCDAQMGRMHATMRTLIWGALPLGALAGGTIAQYFGPAAAIEVGGCIGIASALAMLPCPQLHMQKSRDVTRLPRRTPKAAAAAA